MKVWVVREENEYSVQICKSKETAFELCKSIIEELTVGDEEIYNMCMEILTEEYEKGADSGYFDCENVCYAEMQEVLE